MKSYKEIQVMQIWRCKSCGAERVWGVGDELQEVTPVRLQCAGGCNCATSHVFARSVPVEVTEYFHGYHGDDRTQVIDYVWGEATQVLSEGSGGASDGENYTEGKA